MRDAKCLIWIGISDCALWVIIYKVYYEKNRNVYVYLQYWQMMSLMRVVMMSVTKLRCDVMMMCLFLLLTMLLLSTKSDKGRQISWDAQWRIVNC